MYWVTPPYITFPPSKKTHFIYPTPLTLHWFPYNFLAFYLASMDMLAGNYIIIC